MMDAALTEALNLLQEECGELIVISSKVKRFGAQSENPEQPGLTALDRLIQEIGDVQCLMHLVQQYLSITDHELMQAREQKLAKLKIFSQLPLN
jgi:tRNA A37 methylthiotransferase MiaB